MASTITKILFFREDKDFSKAYEEVSCRKLLIWDFMDEIIPDTASVKNGILQRRKNISKDYSKKLKKENELNE